MRILSKLASQIHKKTIQLLHPTGVINEEAKQEGTVLLQEFKDCVSFSISELGKTDAALLSIRCTTDVSIVYRPYRLSEREKRITREIIQELLDNNIVRKSDSSYASPILLVKKKNGEYRMCVNFRKLNAITVKDKYPKLILEEQINKLESNKYFINLDLASGLSSFSSGRFHRENGLCNSGRPL